MNTNKKVGGKKQNEIISICDHDPAAPLRIKILRNAVWTLRTIVTGDDIQTSCNNQSLKKLGELFLSVEVNFFKFRKFCEGSCSCHIWIRNSKFKLSNP